VTKIRHPMWRADAVEGVANVLGSTDWPGLSGTVIARRLAAAGVPDINPTANKRTRLWTALIAKQQTDQASNCIIAFINHAMAPGNHLDDPSRFTALQDALAEPLALVSLRVNDRGQVARGTVAATLDEVAMLAAGCAPNSAAAASTPRSSTTARKNYCGGRSSTPSSRPPRASLSASASSPAALSTAPSSSTTASARRSRHHDSGSTASGPRPTAASTPGSRTFCVACSVPSATRPPTPPERQPAGPSPNPTPWTCSPCCRSFTAAWTRLSSRRARDHHSATNSRARAPAHLASG
jgi:hypothetical protein